MPSIKGILMSVKTTCGLHWRNLARACLPLTAVATISKPSASQSTMVVRSSMASFSSSTIITEICFMVACLSQNHLTGRAQSADSKTSWRYGMERAAPSFMTARAAALEASSRHSAISQPRAIAASR